MDDWEQFISDDSVPVIIASDLGIIERVNSLFEQTFSWKSSELLGEPISTRI